MKKPTKPIAIFFDEKSYKAHVLQYNQKLEAAAAVDREANRVLGTETLTIQDKAKAVDEFYKIVESLNKDRNPMQLRGEKLVELHGLETIQLDVLSKQFARLKDVEEPTTERWTIYAETPDELARYAQAATLTDAIRQIRPHFFKTRGSVPNFEIQKVFRGILQINTKLNEIEPMVSFIKQRE